MDREQLLRKITMLDFMKTDIALYLNTHHNDHEMIMRFNAICKDCKKLRGMYEAEFGPLSQNSVMQKGEWCWMKNPWPWQEEYNFEFVGDEY